MEIPSKLSALRSSMKTHDIHAYIITGTDPHQSKYITPHWRIREWISGFTGSAGIVVVTTQTAGLWTDSRYFIQAARELDGSGIHLFRQGLPDVPDHMKWLRENLDTGSAVGVNGMEISAEAHEKLKKTLSEKDIRLVLTTDLLDGIWKERPAPPDDTIYALEDRFTGETRKEKIQRVREKMSAEGVEHYLISSLDDIAWLLNLRGSDVKHMPVFLSHIILTTTKTTLFIRDIKVPGVVKDLLQTDGVRLAPYDAVLERLKKTGANHRIAMAPTRVCALFYEAVPETSRKSLEYDITTRFKAAKNKTELAGIRSAMVRDGVAMVKFMYWFYTHPDRESLTELTIAEKIRYFRSLQEHYRGESFNTNASFGEQAAIPHYYPTAATAKPLSGRGLLLTDSGGQYSDGTTDITRVFPVGAPTDAEKQDFTLVLKGHIALAKAVFPRGTTGSQLDLLARKPLWDRLYNYGHGTGHGVGCFLSVHEGPQRISPIPNNVRLEEGMILSNEPGLYREGKYGIRIENLIATVFKGRSEFDEFLEFETLTLCPIETDLIECAMMTDEEIQWLNDYHRTVCEKISPHLALEEKAFLEEKTRPVGEGPVTR